MLEQEKLDVLVVTTIDYTHDMYIIPALKAGIKVLSEKPMTTYVLPLSSIYHGHLKAYEPCGAGT